LICSHYRTQGVTWIGSGRTSSGKMNWDTNTVPEHLRMESVGKQPIFHLVTSWNDTQGIADVVEPAELVMKPSFNPVRRPW
jgi:hypothetical protein